MVCLTSSPCFTWTQACGEQNKSNPGGLDLGGGRVYRNQDRGFAGDQRPDGPGGAELKLMPARCTRHVVGSGKWEKREPGKVHTAGANGFRHRHRFRDEQGSALVKS